MTDINKVETIQAEAQEQQLSPEEQKRLERKAEKERKRNEQYMRSMITRREAFQVAQGAARQAVDQFANWVREPIQVSLIQINALTQLLIDKGVITEDDVKEYVNKILALQQNPPTQGEESNAEAEQVQETTSDSNEETEEQQG